MRSTWLSAAGLLFAVSPAQAQPSFFHELSVEALVLNADAVVVGKIGGVVKGKESNEATVAVEETLRGEHRARLRVRFPNNIWQHGVGGYDAAGLAKLQMDATRLLVATRDQPAQIFGLIHLTDEKPRTGGASVVRKADLSTVETPAEVLRVVRDTLRASPGVKRIDTFPLTVPIKGGYYFGRGGSTRVDVPVDEALEKKAVAYIGAKERWRRTEGAAALKHFKTESNVARLKELLRDAEYHSELAGDNQEVSVRYYTVRKAAFETLQSWGVAVARPLFEEKAPAPR